jgi:hypothetical protein
LKPGDPFDFDVYVSFQNSQQFFMRGGIYGKEPHWSEKGLKYEYSPENERHNNLTIPVTDNLLANNTLYLHTQFRIRNPFYLSKKDGESLGITGEIVTKDFRFNTPEYITFNQSVPLIRYMPKLKEEVKRNLLSDDIPMPAAKKTEGSEEDDGKFHAYFKKELYLYVIYDPQTYSLGEGGNGPPAPVLKFMKIDRSVNHYFPAIYLSDYWCLKKDLVHINDTVKDLNLTLHFNTYSLNYFIMQK